MRLDLSLGFIQVWRRNRDVFMKTWKTNFLPPVLEPMLYLLAMGLGFGALVSPFEYRGVQVDYIQFIAGGLVAIAVMYGAFFECTYSTYVRMHYQKTFDAIVATPLSVEDVIVGEIAWGATKSLINATIVLIVITAFGLVTSPTAVLIPVVIVITGVMFASMAMMFTSLVPNLDSFNYPFFLLIMPMFLFSGTFFPLTVLPGWGQGIAMLLPLTHVSNLVRDLQMGYFDIVDMLGLVYIVLLTIITLTASVVMMRRRLVR